MSTSRVRVPLALLLVFTVFFTVTAIGATGCKKTFELKTGDEESRDSGEGQEDGEGQRDAGPEVIAYCGEDGIFLV